MQRSVIAEMDALLKDLKDQVRDRSSWKDVPMWSLRVDNDLMTHNQIIKKTEGISLLTFGVKTIFHLIFFLEWVGDFSTIKFKN